MSLSSGPTPDNIAQEQKPVQCCLILSEQHDTGKNPMQCCPRGFRQHCTEKNPVQCCLNTPGTTLHRENSCSMLS